MTTMNSVNLKCPGCGEPFTGVYYPSICTWLNPELIQEIHDIGYTVECPHCQKRVPIEAEILINAPIGMFLLDTSLNLPQIRHALDLAGLIGEDGRVMNREGQIAAAEERRSQPESPNYFV